MRSLLTRMKVERYRRKSISGLLMGIMYLSVILVPIYFTPFSFYFQVSKDVAYKLRKFFYTQAIIQIEGNKHLSKDRILAPINLHINLNYILADLYKVKQLLEEITWIEEASVYRILPNRVFITIKEKKAEAIWVLDNVKFLVEQNGKVIEVLKPNGKEGRLITIIGARANERFVSLQKAMQERSLYYMVKEATLIKERRWDLQLDNGIVVKLPEKAGFEVFEYLKKLLASLANDKVEVIDLRLYPKRVLVKK